MAGSRDAKSVEITRTQALVMKACGKATADILSTTGIKSTTFYELQKRATNAGYQPGDKVLPEHVQGGTSSAGPGAMPLTPIKKVVKKTPTQGKGKGKAVDKPVKPESDEDEDEDEDAQLDKKDEDAWVNKKEEKVIIKPEPMVDDFEDDYAV